MKRQTGQQLAARREAVSLALSNLVDGGWIRAVVASQLKFPQGVVSRDLAAVHKVWRDFPIHVPQRVRVRAEPLPRSDALSGAYTIYRIADGSGGQDERVRRRVLAVQNVRNQWNHWQNRGKTKDDNPVEPGPWNRDERMENHKGTKATKDLTSL